MWYSSPSLLKLLDMANNAPLDSPRPLTVPVYTCCPDLGQLFLKVVIALRCWINATHYVNPFSDVDNYLSFV